MQCCEEPHFINNDSGQKICQSCGVVQEECSLVNAGFSLHGTFYALDDGIMVSKRTGMTGRGFGDLHVGGTVADREMALEGNMTRVARAAEQALRIQGTADRALEIYMQMRLISPTRRVGRTMLIDFAGCIYTSARQIGLPLTFESIAAFAGCTAREVGAAYKRIQRFLGLPADPPIPLEAYLDIACKNLTPDPTQTDTILSASRRLLQFGRSKGLHENRQGRPLIGACVCLAYEAEIGRRCSSKFLTMLAGRLQCLENAISKRQLEVLGAVRKFAEGLPWYEDLRNASMKVVYSHLKDILQTLPDGSS
ncbi:hypothetical protein HDU67_001814 [Dinochytrium kinnereticum]|nr:hypothetical protein HDU67_001814 [Dinochytrium kinnereticum]